MHVLYTMLLFTSVIGFVVAAVTANVRYVALALAVFALVPLLQMAQKSL